jgi:Protein of unknown function (DUF2905)
MATAPKGAPVPVTACKRVRSSARPWKAGPTTPFIAVIVTSFRRTAQSSVTVRSFGAGYILMARFLIILGLAILLTGLLWPWLSRLGLGRLPGDIVIERNNITLYFPIVTSLVLSLSISLILWFLNR